MKKIKLASKLIVIVISFLISVSIIFGDTIEKIIANVNGVGIPLSDLKQYAEPYIKLGRIKDTRQDMLTILEVMVDEELIYQICEKNGVSNKISELR